MKNMFKKLLSLAIALVMIVGMIPGNAFSVFATEESTWDGVTISSLEELILFRDAVNAGDGYAGKTVTLTADIDMSSVDWSVNIGDDCNTTFDGIFDGNGHTLKNLTATETAAKADGFFCTGLFGAIYGSAQIKNLTIENVNINTGSFTGNNAAAVVGFAYSTTGSVENVKVIGDIQINAVGITGTGAIVGYDYYGNLTVKDCVVSGNTGSAITGRAYAGGVIGYASTNSTLSGNTVSNVAVTATGAAAGGIAGIQLAGGVATGNTVQNVTLASQGENWKSAVGVIVGTVTGAITVSGNTCEGVSAEGQTITNLVGAEHQDKPTEPVKAVVASVGTKNYTSLAEAVANADGKTVTLLSNVTLTDKLTIAGGTTVTLELNGYTISQTKAQTTGYEMILVDGSLTVQDSVGGGKISYTDTVGGNFVSNTITNRGTLILKSGTIENMSSAAVADAGFPYAIDSSIWGPAAEVNTIIEGGKVYCESYSAIRLRADSPTENVNVTITGGEVYGRIEVQNPTGNKASAGTLTITDGIINKNNSSMAIMVFGGGGTAENMKVDISGGTFTGKIGYSSYFPISGFDENAITGGTFDTDVSDFVAEGYTLETNGDGTYGVKKWDGLPTATVTKLDKKDLTFALNFTAVEPTAAQLAYYGDWYADFELTINKEMTFNADGSADGYLSGQYDAWSENWVNVPDGSYTLAANESVKIMETAAALWGSAGLKLTYNDVATFVKDFDCGLYLDPEFLHANPDIEITLELRMYNPADETESYVIGDTYVFTLPELPTATTEKVDNDELTFAMTFDADEVTEQQLDFYGNWYADFELSANKDITLNADGGADGWLSGQYDEWSENWVNVPFSKGDVTLNAGEPLKIMEYASELMGKPGLKYTYKEVYEVVKLFNCGMYLTPEFIAANPDIEITLELKMYDPADEDHSHQIGQTYVFKFEDAVAMNMQTGKLYSRVDEALEEAFDAGEDQTVILLKDTDGYKHVSVYENTVFDLNGFTLSTKNFSSFGNVVDNSEANTGALVTDRILIEPTNEQLTVKTDKGYQFIEIVSLQSAALRNNTYFAFVPDFEAAALPMLAQGVAASGVTVQVEISWVTEEGHTRTQLFQYSDDLVNGFIASYNPETEWYGKMFTLTLADAGNYSNVTFTVNIVSDTGVTYPA